MSDAAPMEQKVELRAGEIGVGVGEGPQKGHLILALPVPAKWVAMSPQQAVAIAKDLIDKAVSLGMNVEILIPRRPMSQTKRTLIVNRVDIVMRSMQEKKRASRYIAEELVDIVLRDSGA